MAKPTNIAGVFNRLSSRIITKVRESSNSTLQKEVKKLLNTKVANGGCSAFDELRFTYSKKRKHTTHSKDKWYIQDRSNTAKLKFEFGNKARYARFIYTNTPSRLHPNGYVSNTPHIPVKYKGNIYYRYAQVSSESWAKCQKRFSDLLKNAIKRGFKL